MFNLIWHWPDELFSRKPHCIMDSSNDELRRTCQEVVERLCAQYQWSLLRTDTLTTLTVAAVGEHPGAEIAYLVMGIYNQALYTACTASEGPERWELAYRELYAMLSAQARLRYPEIWEDAVQIALEATSQRLERCHEPRAFFLFAWNYVRNAARTLRPRARRRGSSEEAFPDGAAYHLFLSDLVPDTGPSVEDRLLSAEQRAAVRAILSDLDRSHPRARRQLAAVRLKYLDGKDDVAIGAALGVPVKRVHELRSLGLKRLRTDARLRRLADGGDGEPDGRTP